MCCLVLQRLERRVCGKHSCPCRTTAVFGGISCGSNSTISFILAPNCLFSSHSLLSPSQRCWTPLTRSTCSGSVWRTCWTRQPRSGRLSRRVRFVCRAQQHILCMPFCLICTQTLPGHYKNNALLVFRDLTSTSFSIRLPINVHCLVLTFARS